VQVTQEIVVSADAASNWYRKWTSWDDWFPLRNCQLKII